MNISSLLVRVQKFLPLFLVLLSAALTVASYMQAINYPFISDDKIYVTDNTKLIGLPLAELWRLFTEPYNSMEFLPLRDISYWLDMALFGTSPAAFRLHNILLYLLCLPLVYGTTLRLWRYFRPADATSAPWAAAAVTALFALHPAHVEAVVWISGRKDVLSGLFSLLALWFAMNTRREQRFSISHAVAALVALLAAMLSKATAVAVAPIITLLWIIFWRDIPVSNRRYSQLLWPLASLLLAACFTLLFSAYSTVKIPAYFGIEAVERGLAVLGWMARLAVSPENRHLIYMVFEDTYLPVMVAAGGAVLASATVGGVMLLRKRSLGGFALVMFLLFCIPYTHLIPFDTPTLVADRWLMLAVWPVILLIVSLSWCLKPLYRVALLLVIALPWGFQTIERPRDWRSLEVIVDTDLRTYPGYYLLSYQKIIFQLISGLELDAGKTASSITDPEAQNIMIGLVLADNAVRYKTPISGNPNEAMALLQNLEILLKQPPVQSRWNTPMRSFFGRCQQTLATRWERLAEQFPGDAPVRYNTGLSLLDAHRYEDAVAHLRASTESQYIPEPVRGQAFYSLGMALMNSGHIEGAEAPLRAALKQPQPDLRSYCLLSKVYEKTRRIEEAARAEEECRRQAPSEGVAQ